MDLYAELVALLDDGRLFQHDLFLLGADYAVALHAYRCKCIPHAFILFL